MSEQKLSLLNLTQLSSLFPDASLEFLTHQKEIEPAWKLVFEKLQDQNHQQSSFPGCLNKMLIESGVTFNHYEDNFSISRPWNLDPIPLAYSGKDWDTLSEGLEQRALVWDYFLKDIYGEMKIVKEGVIPDEIIYNNKSYLRPCLNLGLNGSYGFFNYSADLIRDQNGNFKVVGDKAQNPFGIGYTLENRLALSRIYESAFAECRVKRLAGFFKSFSASLKIKGRQLDQNPKIVILTPGPYNEGYYEHNLLSRYLGYSLVRGSDLVVRNAMVYLKTIEGLKRVHVILRRQLDTFCDPLELRPDSVLGIPGLVQANRMGNVKVINTLGSGIINDQIFLHFYERICSYYLGVSPKIKSVDTLWLKNPDSLKMFKEFSDRYLLYEIMQGINNKIEVSSLSEENFHKKLQIIEKNPEKYMAVATPKTKKVPTFINNRVKLASYKLRTFLCKNEAGFTTLDGALCLAAQEGNPCSISIQSAQISKDTWIVSEEKVPFVSLLSTDNMELAVQRSSSDMPSSVIDNLLWLSRYMERAESLLRVMNYIYNSLMNETGYDLDLLIKLYSSVVRPGSYTPIYSEYDLEKRLLDVFTDESSADSLCFLLNRALENASVSRSRISVDTWKLLSTLRNSVANQPSKTTRSEASAFIGTIMNLISAFNGLCNENMTRETGWRFLDTGKRIERIDHTSRMIKILLGSYVNDEKESNALKILLDVADSSMTYNSRYFTSLQIIPAMDLLTADDTNPRSLYFQLMRLNEHFNTLPGNRQYPRNSEQQILSQILNDFNQIDFKELLKPDEYNQRTAMINYLDNLLYQLGRLSESINRTYLSHVYNKTETTYSET